MEVPDFLTRYDPDPLRFYLTAPAPETRDTDFSWEDFVERNNHVLSEAEGNELVATWGNLANRMLSFAYKRFDGRVPEPGELDDEDRALLEKVEARFETVGELYNACRFRAALGAALAPSKALTTCGPRGRSCEATAQLTRSVSPGPQGALVPDQGGPGRGGDDGVRHPADRRQPEDDPGAHPTPHGPKAARVPGLRREVVRHAARRRVPGGNAQP